MISPKKLTRQQRFAKLGRALSAIRRSDPDMSDRDYHTGRPSYFYIANGDSQDGHKLSGGPQFKTPQWQRTVKVVQ